MYEELQQLKKIVENQGKQIDRLTQTVLKLSETTYKTGKREIINREVQFLQKVYDKNGAVVTEINS